MRWENGRGYQENPHFWSAIKKYGWDGFKHNVIHKGLDEHSAKELEKFYIWLFATQDRECGYNMTSGGDGSPNYHQSEETKRKHAEASRRENLSEETRHRRSESLKNRKLSEVHKKRIGEGNSKPIDMLSKNGEYIKSFKSAREAELEMNISHSHISQCCNGRRESSGGYKWRFSQIA